MGQVLALRLAHSTAMIGPKPAADGECCKTETVKFNPSRRKKNRMLQHTALRTIEMEGMED